MKLLDFLLSDERGHRARSVDQDHESRIRRLEEDNRTLREVLRVVVSALEQQGIVDRYPGGDLVARSNEDGASRGVGAKFACSRCGSLLIEGELARVDGEFVCEPCNVEPEPGPVNEGSYR